MLADRFEEACPKFAESHRLDPAAGTLLNLALCHEKLGRTASAWLEYHEAWAAAKKERNAEREQIAQQRIRELQALLSRVRVTLPRRLPRGFWIAIDGTRLDPSSVRLGVPVNPGEHELTAGAVDKRTEVLSVRVEPSPGWTVVVLPQLSDVNPLPTTAPVGPGSKSRVRPILMGFTAGLALASTAAATYFGVRAMNDWAARDRRCKPNGCDSVAVALGESARESALAANVSVGIALASLGVTAYLLLLREPPMRSSSPSVGSSPPLVGAALVATGSL